MLEGAWCDWKTEPYSNDPFIHPTLTASAESPGSWTPCPLRKPVRAVW